jgi:hypothetical protein
LAAKSHAAHVESLERKYLGVIGLQKPVHLLSANTLRVF